MNNTVNIYKCTNHYSYYFLHEIDEREDHQHKRACCEHPVVYTLVLELVFHLGVVSLILLPSDEIHLVVPPEVAPHIVGQEWQDHEGSEVPRGGVCGEYE